MKQKEFKEFGLHGEITPEKRLIFTVAERAKRTKESRLAMKKYRDNKEKRTR